MSIYLQEKKDICGPHVLINQNPSYQVLFQKKKYKHLSFISFDNDDDIIG